MRRQTLPGNCFTTTLNQPSGDRRANRQTNFDIEKQTDRKTDAYKLTEGQTDWQPERQIDRGTDRQTGRQLRKQIGRGTDRQRHFSYQCPGNVCILLTYLSYSFKHMWYMQVHLRERFDQILRKHMRSTWIASNSSGDI